MRILFCVKALSAVGGAERVMAEIANGLGARGQDVAVLAFEAANVPPFYAYDETIGRHGLGEALGAGQSLSPRGLFRLRRTIGALSPDLVIAFMPSAYVPVALALAGSGIPVIASEHNLPDRYRGSKARWLSIRATRPVVAAYTAVTGDMRTRFPAAMQAKMSVVPNPLPAPRAERADPVGPPDGPRTLLAVGRLHEQKDHLTLVRAFGRVAAANPGWRLRIVGEGDQRPALEAQIDALGLGDRVDLAGTTDNIEAEYAAAQLFVIPSRWESFGLVTAEALAHGLPAVGFADCPGTRDLIADGRNGVLVAPGEDRVGALADALSPLLADPEARKDLATGLAAADPAHALPAVLDVWQALVARTVHRRGDGPGQ